MNTKRIATSVLIVGLLSSASAQQFNPRGGGARPGMPNARFGAQAAENGERERRNPSEAMPDEHLMSMLAKNERMAEQLGLSAEQRAKLTDAVQASRAQYETLRKELEAAAMQQARVISAGEVDEQALMAAIDETFRARAEIAKLKMKQIVTMRQTLTAEQLKQARSSIRERVQRRMSERGGGMRQRPGQTDGDRQRPMRRPGTRAE